MAMALFTKKDDPVRDQRALEAQLKAKVAQQTDGARRLQAAEGRVDQARVNVEALALEPDEAKLDAALQARRAAEDKVSALQAASVTIGKEISSIESAIEAARDKLMRGETAAAVDDIASRLTMAAADFGGIAQVLEDILREASLIVLDAHGCVAFTMSAKQQLPPAIDVVLVGLRNHAHAVVHGGAPASLPRAAPEPVPLTLVEPPTMVIFPVKPLKYTDAQGTVICLGAMRRHTVPKAIGERALRRHLALTETDPRTRATEGVSGMLTPSASNCTSIDGTADVESEVANKAKGGNRPEPIRHSAFEETIGKPIVGVMPVRPTIEVAGTRKDGGGES